MPCYSQRIYYYVPNNMMVVKFQIFILINFITLVRIVYGLKVKSLDMCRNNDIIYYIRIRE